MIPALNAQATIGPVVAAARRHVPRTVVVDDGSVDATGEAARRAGAEVIRHATNLGKGAALTTAFDALRTERGSALQAVITLDADGQHDPDDIPAFVELHRRERPAIIVGSRQHHFAEMWGPRRAMNRFSSAALRFFTGANLPDTQSGFRLYDAGFLAALRLSGRRYEAEMEALMQATARKLSIASVPIRLPVVDGRATSHYRPLSDTFRIIGTVLRLWLGRRATREQEGP